MRQTSALRLLLLLVVSAAGTPVHGADGPPATIGVDEIHRGQSGYGYTVFAGAEPERFELEVLGVLRKSTPELSYILARLSGHGLERDGVVAGMSGSPVYIDGRLAGAVSFGYVFGLDPVAGITPIGAMHRLSTYPAAAPAAASPGVDLDALVRRQLPVELLAGSLRRLRPPALADGRSTLLWSAAGFAGPAVGLLQQAVGALATGGGGGAAPATLEPGSAVAGVLVDGDLNLSVHGTVTDRRGDEIYAFGHPVFSFGPVAIPMASSEVVTVVASRANSFKVANSGPVVGAFDQDRQAGVRGRLGAVAPTIPMEVHLRGLAERSYSLRVASLPQLTPSLLAIASLGALDAGSYAFGNQGLDLTARFRLSGFDDLVVRQSFDGDQAGLDSAVYLLSFADFLMRNRYRKVGIESVDVELTQTDRPRTASLVAAHADRSHVEPGETVPITLELQPYRGTAFRRVVEVVIPDDTPDGRYMVLLGDGTSMDAALLSIERRQPVTFDQVLRLLRSFHSRRELQVFGLFPDPGLAVAGEVLPQLPGSVRSIFAGSGSRNGTPVWLTIAGRQVEPLDQPIQGVQRVDLKVKRGP